MKRKIFLIAIAILLALSFPTAAFADFGDFAGGSDWGYSDFGGGYSDFGGYDSWDSGYDYYDYDYGYNGTYYGNNSDRITFVDVIVTVFIILIVVAFVILRAKTSKNISRNRPVNIPAKRQETTVNDIAGLKARDPGFNESKFIGDVSNLYVRFQDAWTAKDLSDLRPHLTEELYAKSDRQIKGYIQRGQTNHVERVSVLSAKIVGCTKDAKNDIVTVEILSRICDYITDDRTGNIIRGDMNKELFMTYRWTLIRTLGKQTAEGELVDDKKCPNCGAPIDLNRSAVCEYCGSVVTSSEYDWVVSDIRGISQRS